MLIERELVLQDCNTRFGKGPNAKFLDKLKEAASREFDRQVVAKSKKKLNLKSDQELKDYLKNAGVSFDVLRKQFEKQFIYQQYIQFRVGPALDRFSYEDFRDYFDKHPEEFENVDTVQWQDIFVAASSYPSREQARQTALQVEGRMKEGEDIEKLMSLDNGDSVYRKGEGLGNKRGQIKPPEAEPVLFQLKDNETSIIETAGGYHVVRVVKRQQAGQMPFDEKIQGAIRDKLRNEALLREAKQFIRELKSQAAIEIAKE
jgi:parvulin-like peptidyl-prolyl isomerase